MSVKWYDGLMFDGPVKPAYLAFVADVDAAFVRDGGSGLRYGQTYFNMLSEVLPEAAEKLRGASCDPFHANEVSDITHELVELYF